MTSTLRPGRLVCSLALALLLVCCSRENRPAPRILADTSKVRTVRLAGLGEIPGRVWESKTFFSTDGNDSIRIRGSVDAVFASSALLLVGSGPEIIGLTDTSTAVLAREGDGPGEFRSIFRLGIAGDSSIFASDLWTERFTQLALPHDVRRTIARFKLDSLGREIDPVSVLADGTIISTLWQWRPNRGSIAGIPSAPFERDPVPLFLTKDAGPATGVLGIWPGLERAIVQVGSEPSRLPVPFARSTLYDGRGNATAITLSDSLDLWLFVDSSAVLHLIAPPKASSPSDGDLQKWKGELTAKQPDIAAMVLEAERDVALGPSFPSIGGLVVDNLQRLWVGQYVTPGTPSRDWYVLDKEGNPLGTLKLPALVDPLNPGRTELLDVVDNRLALLREDSTGALHVDVRGFSASQ